MFTERAERSRVDEASFEEVVDSRGEDICGVVIKDTGGASNGGADVSTVLEPTDEDLAEGWNRSADLVLLAADSPPRFCSTRSRLC